MWKFQNHVTCKYLPYNKFIQEIRRKSFLECFFQNFFGSVHQWGIVPTCILQFLARVFQFQAEIQAIIIYTHSKVVVIFLPWSQCIQVFRFEHICRVCQWHVHCQNLILILEFWSKIVKMYSIIAVTVIQLNDAKWMVGANDHHDNTKREIERNWHGMPICTIIN